MILSGKQLDVALGRTDRMISLLDAAANKVRDITPDQAIPLLLAGYEAGGSKRRVHYVRLRRRVDEPVPLPDNRSFKVDESFWAGRGCIRFWKEQRTAYS